MLKTIRKAGEGSVLVNATPSEEFIAKNGNKYRKLQLSDGVDTATLTVFEEKPYYAQISAWIQQRAFVQLKFSMRGKFENWELVGFEERQALSLTECVDKEAIRDELRNIVRTVKDKGLSSLLKHVLGGFKDSYFEAPGAKEGGYAFRGGLAAHTVRLCRLIDATVGVYQNWEFNVNPAKTDLLSRDLLISACILHDIGKIQCFGFDEKGIPEETFQGQLSESGLISVQMLNELLQTAQLTGLQKQLLMHIVASSSNGERAQVGPKTLEAMAFHFIEKLDTQMAFFEYLNRISIGSNEFQSAPRSNKSYCLMGWSDTILKEPRSADTVDLRAMVVGE